MMTELNFLGGKLSLSQKLFLLFLHTEGFPKEKCNEKPPPAHMLFCSAQLAALVSAPLSEIETDRD